MIFFSSGRESLNVILDNSTKNETEKPIRSEGHDIVRHSNVAENFTINYTEFANLPPYPKETDLMFIFNNIKQHFDSGNWMDTFNSIDNLRILNKYNGDEINLIFQAFGNYILDSVLSQKTAVVKNILAFFKEVLQRGEQTKLDLRVIVKLIQILLNKSKSPHKAIRLMAEDCLGSLVENFTCDETLSEFCSNTIRKNKLTDKIGFHYLAASISVMNENISKISNETLRLIFVTMRLVINSDSGENKSLAKRILRFMNQLMGIENFTRYIEYLVLNNILNKLDAEELIDIIKEKPKIRPSIALSLKERRSVNTTKYKPSFELY